MIRVFVGFVGLLLSVFFLALFSLAHTHDKRAQKAQHDRADYRYTMGYDR